MTRYILEPERRLPVLDEVDVLVLGGSCTGVFAAVRAARLGARAAVVEADGCFGGCATLGLVNIWHSKYDTEGKTQIIGGLSAEIENRLEKRNLIIREFGSDCAGAHLNTEELKIELDEIIRESGAIPRLHTRFCAPIIESGSLAAVAVEDKNGRGAIRAKVFIDATGDGDLCRRLGLPTYTREIRQPPTTGALIRGFSQNLLGMPSYGKLDLNRVIREHGSEVGLPEGWGWCGVVPQLDDITFSAITRVNEVDCSKAEDLTFAEMEGRRQLRGIMDLARRYGSEDKPAVLVNSSSSIGIRETRHVRSMHCLTQQEVLNGTRFDDAIANGSYRVDVHNDKEPGLIFRFLDGREVFHRLGDPPKTTRWRPESETSPTFYQIPYRCLIPGGFDNLLMAGRMIDADEGAFGAIRVMINCNQMGEAAGVAAALAAKNGAAVDKLDPASLRGALREGGSIII